MAITDSIADFLTGIRNASRAKKETVTVPGSKEKVRLVEILKERRYIKDYTEVTEGPKKFLHIKLRYLKSGKPAITDIQRVSKPGLKTYAPATKIPKVLSGLGTMVVSTSKGIMTDYQARKENMGGELVFKVW